MSVDGQRRSPFRRIFAPPSGRASRLIMRTSIVLRKRRGGRFADFYHQISVRLAKPLKLRAPSQKSFIKNKIKYCSFLNMRRVLAAGHPKHRLCRFPKRGSKKKKPPSPSTNVGSESRTKANRGLLLRRKKISSEDDALLIQVCLCIY